VDSPTRIRLLHQAKTPSQADIWLVEWNGTECVLRDYSAPRGWFWRQLCRWAVRREIRAHNLLDGVTGIPSLLAELDKNRYLIEFIDGPSLDIHRHSLGPEFFEELARILDAMHKRRVAHGDLRNKNILVGPDGRPYIIDFTTAWRGTSWWRKPFFEFWKYLDRRRFLVSKAKFMPETLSPEEVLLLEERPLYLRLGNFYRRKVYPRIASRQHSQEKQP
jgi:serine/threonine protein kinase